MICHSHNNWLIWCLFFGILPFPQFVSARNGSFCNTFMAKSDFWSSSLPRSLPRRKVRKYNCKDKILTIWDQFANMYIFRWLSMTRLLNGLPLPLQLVSSQSTPWRTSLESHKPTTRLPISNDPQLFPLSAHAALKTKERKRAKWNAGKTFVPLTPEYLPFIQNVWSHA